MYKTWTLRHIGKGEDLSAITLYVSLARVVCELPWTAEFGIWDNTMSGARNLRRERSLNPLEKGSAVTGFVLQR